MCVWTYLRNISLLLINIVYFIMKFNKNSLLIMLCLKPRKVNASHNVDLRFLHANFGVIIYYCCTICLLPDV